MQNRETILPKRFSEERGKHFFIDFAAQLHQIYLNNPTKAPFIVKYIQV